MLQNILAIIDFMNPETVIQYGGLTLLIIIIFAETGVFFGFFLPGDSLLFVAGLLSDSPALDYHVSFLIPVVIAAAVAGSTVGYFTGKWAGGYLEKRKENFFYKKSYLEKTRDFYIQYGMMAFILGRFLPIIRTFVTILAGTAGIDFPKFFLFNVIGASIWVTSMIMSGHLLGNSFPEIKDHLELIVISMVLVSAIPVVLIWLRKSVKSSKGSTR